MQLMRDLILKFLCMFLNCIGTCFSGHREELNCGVCIALIDEMNWKINSADQKSTIQVGSFRIDSKGDQNLREIPFARSELHITELLEEICTQMSNYGLSIGDDGNHNYIRTSMPDGSGVTLKNVQISADVHSRLMFACETLIEEYEDDLLELFQSDDTSAEHTFCVETIEICKPNNITDQREAMKVAISTAQQTVPDDNDDDDNDEDDETSSDEAITDSTKFPKDDL